MAVGLDTGVGVGKQRRLSSEMMCRGEAVNGSAERRRHEVWLKARRQEEHRRAIGGGVREGKLDAPACRSDASLASSCAASNGLP